MKFHFDNNKNFNSFSSYMKKLFNSKIIKLSLDGGFTCPHRDLSGSGGCIFCSNEGSGEFSGVIDENSCNNLNPYELIENYRIRKVDSIQSQLNSQIKLLKNKWPKAKYIAYFQNFTNTYGPYDYLKKIYTEALSFDDVVGIAIATRPDCIDDKVLELFSTINKNHYIYVELGVQTSNEKTVSLINRGYSNDVIENVCKKLNKLNIPTVAHLIFNLPYENQMDFINSIEFVNKNKFSGVKIHMLNVLKNTSLENFYNKNPFYIMSEDEYVKSVCLALEHLCPKIVIHRLTGDGKKSDLIAPKWILNKRSVLNNIDRYQIKNNSYQGKFFND